MRKFFKKFLDLFGFFKISRHLLQTIGTKEVAKGEKKENNVSMVASAIALKFQNSRTFGNCHKTLSISFNYREIDIKSKSEDFVEN